VLLDSITAHSRVRKKEEEWQLYSLDCRSGHQGYEWVYTLLLSSYKGTRLIVYSCWNVGPMWAVDQWGLPVYSLCSVCKTVYFSNAFTLQDRRSFTALHYAMMQSKRRDVLS
jgi:hypothetical protein